MRNFIMMSFLIFLVFSSCKKESQKEDTTHLTVPASVTQNIDKQMKTKAVYMDMVRKHIAKKIKFKQKKYKNDFLPPSEGGPVESQNGIYYYIGDPVGDPYDEVTAADGLTIIAASIEDEAAARTELLGTIDAAKNYLNSYGLDFSDEYSSDDFRYVHAANLLIEVIEREGDPSTYGQVSVNGKKTASGQYKESKQDTIIGCILKATGIKALVDAWANKAATKAMIFKAVGKVASRYLGYVGAAIAMYDLAECLFT